VSSNVLLVRAGGRLCTLPLQHVEETMRPLPCETLPDVPTFVRGVSIVRGEPTPIVDLCELLGDDENGCTGRLVVLRTDDTRRVGLLVDDVLGIRDGKSLSTAELPPLLHEALPDVVQTLARLDEHLLTVLRTGSLIPEDVWARLEPQGEPS